MKKQPTYGPRDRDIPFLSQLLDYQPFSSRQSIAAYLGISERSLRRYEAKNNAPRAIELALWYQTGFSRDQEYSEVLHAFRLYKQLAETLSASNAALRRELDSLKITKPQVLACGNDDLFYAQLELFAQA